jgi:hypothetical protein
MRMSLLRDIQNETATAGGDVVSVLRKCKVLASRLSSDELTRWVDFELDGYPESQPIPDYQRLRVNCYANFMNIRWRANSQDVPPFAIPEEYRESIFSPVEFRDGITVAIAYSGEGASIEASKLQILIQRHRVMFPQMQCSRAWKVIAATEFQQLISAVNNRILDFSLKIESENPSAGEAPPNSQPISRSRLQPLVQNTFYGPVGNLSQNGERITQTANMGVEPQDLTRLVDELTAHLDELHLDSPQRQRAEAQIATLKAELIEEPNADVVRQAGRTLRNITEGAIGSLIATAAQPTVWHWVHQTLVALAST